MPSGYLSVPRPIIGSIWRYYMPVPAFCQQESKKFGGFPPKRRNWSGIPQHFAWRKRGKAPPFGGALACFAVKREKIGKDGAAEP